MRKLIPTTSFINKVSVLTVKKYFTYTLPTYFPPAFDLKNWLLRKILNVKDAEIIVAESGATYSERLLVAQLSAQNFLHYYGEGVLYSDYPKFHYAAIFFYVDKAHSEEIQTAWGYTLPYHTAETALSKAVGEALERQASYYIPQNTLASFPKLTPGDASHLYPYIPKFTKTQIENEPLLVGTAEAMKSLLGFTAPSLTGARRRFFPFEAFYWGLPASPEQRLFQHTTTSGSGGGKTKAEAILSGCYELIERDLFMLYWLSGVVPMRLQNDTLPEPFANYVKRCEARYGLEVYFLELTYDLTVLTGVCVVIDPVLHRITMGAKTGLDAQSVLEGALLEALAVMSTTRAKDEAWSEEELKDLLSKTPYSQTINRKGRVNMYSNPLGVHLVRNTFLTGEEITFDTFNRVEQKKCSPENELASLLDQLKTLVHEKGDGYHAYVHHFSSPWLKKMHYHAAHVFIPSFMKLHLNERFAAPLSPRLEAFAATHGKSITAVHDLNPLPHFFP
jgi:ribosomal protein S12 methylthiotransferase accessory factor